MKHLLADVCAFHGCGERDCEQEAIMIIHFKDLVGYKIEAQDGGIGSVHDLLFDQESWTVRYVVVDTGGWLFGRKVLVSPACVGEAAAGNETLPVELSKEQIKDSPEIPIDPPLSREEEARYRDYYKWPYYWPVHTAFDRLAMVSVAPEATALGSSQPVQTPPPPIPEARSDPMLRSARKVSGFSLRGDGDDSGSVEDFIVDTEAWQITHLLVEVDGDERELAVESVASVGKDEDVVELTGSPETPASTRASEGASERLRGNGDHYQRRVE
jgi:hypothetical protein